MDTSSSWIGLTLDLWSAKALVWLASIGRDAHLTREAHSYFYDRYSRLAAYHRARGRRRRANRLQAVADTHYQPGSFDDPPFAAAMAMPRPRRFVRTDAVSRHRLGGPDDAA